MENNYGRMMKFLQDGFKESVQHFLQELPEPRDSFIRNMEAQIRNFYPKAEMKWEYGPDGTVTLTEIKFNEPLPIFVVDLERREVTKMP